MALLAAIPELGPVAVMAAGALSTAAVANLNNIKSAFTGSTFSAIASRTIAAYATIKAELEGKSQTTTNTQAQDALTIQQMQLQAEATAQITALVNTFLGTRFSSRLECDQAFDALLPGLKTDYISYDLITQVYNYYYAEMDALLQPSVAGPSTTISNPPATDTLTTPLAGAGEATGAEALGGTVALTAAGIAAALVGVAENLGCGLQRGTYQCQDTGFASTMARILPSIAPLGMIAFLNNPQIAQQFTDPLTKVFLDQFVMMPEVQKPITPDEAPSVVRAIFSRAMGLGIGAHLAAEVAESSTTLKYMGLNYIAAFLCDMAGFSKIAAATMGVVESQALGLPMKYYINQRVRTELPRMGDLLRMAEHYELTEGEFHYLAACNNFSDELITKYWHIAHRPAGYFMLRRMAASGIWDETYYTGALRDTGFDPETCTYALQMLYSEAHADLKAIGVGPAMTRFKEGLDFEEALKTNLQTLGVTQELIPKYVFAARLAEDYDEFTDYKAAIIDAVRKGLATPDDLESMLVQRGLAPARARLLADRERIRLYPKAKTKA